MGLYDYVKVGVKLPDLPFKISKDILWQTKDFPCPYLEYYFIKRNRRLIHNKPQYDITPQNETCGLVDLNFHGILNFYTTIEGEWFEYDAKFTDGIVVGFTRIKANP